MDRHLFGQLLQWIRQKNGISQQELAEEVDCVVSTISRIENGHEYPGMKLFKEFNRVFESLGVTYEELVMDHIFEFTRAKKELLEAIRNGRQEEIERKLDRFHKLMDEDDAEDKQYYVLAQLIFARRSGLAVEDFLDQAIGVFELRRKIPDYEDISKMKLTQVEYEILYMIAQSHALAGDTETAEQIYKGLLANGMDKNNPYVHDKYMEISAELAKLCLGKGDYKTARNCLSFVFGGFIRKTDVKLLYKIIHSQIHLCEKAGDMKGVQLVKAFRDSSQQLMEHMYSMYLSRED